MEDLDLSVVTAAEVDEKVIELNKALCEKYPFLTWYGNPLYIGYSEDHEPSYGYTWEDEMEIGWRKAFCPQIWDELKEILVEGDYLNDFRFMQIKEKYGALRLYSGGVPDAIFKKLMAWEEKYLKLSEEYCVFCGKHPTKYMTLGWNRYVCEDCKNEIQLESLKKYGQKERLIPIEDLDEFYKDRAAYCDAHPVE